MTTATNSQSTDWEAATTVAEMLGKHTRELVASRHQESALAWCLRMERENRGHDPRSASYLELACLLGHTTEPQPDSDKTDGE